MSNFLESKKVRAVLWSLGGLIVLVLVFGLGIAVGYDRAGFASGFNRNYFRVFFGGSSGGPMGLVAPSMPMATHGAVGAVIDIGSSTISMTNQQGNEQSVAVSSDTDIRDGDDSATIGDVALGDQIAVIGEPNDEGQINARFIRILSASLSGNH